MNSFWRWPLCRSASWLEDGDGGGVVVGVCEGVGGVGVVRVGWSGGNVVPGRWASSAVKSGGWFCRGGREWCEGVDPG